MRFLTAALVLSVPVLGACTIASESSSDAGPNAPAATEGGSNTEAAAPPEGGSDAAASPLGFTPSNVDLTGMDLSKADDVIISDANCAMDTENLNWCVNANKFVAKVVTLPDQSRLAIFVVKSLRIEQSSLLDLRAGHIPAAIVALDTMTLLGSIKVRPGIAGGAFNAQTGTKGAGPGGGGGGPVAQKAAGGGGSFCGIGGQGSAVTGATAYPKSMAYGTAELVPLTAGSAGGVGAGSFADDSAAGGGAIELVAGTSIELQTSGFIAAPGAGGSGGGLIDTQPSAGGGSGGGILIEAPMVKIAGAVTANGGAGGGWLATPGQPGRDSNAMPALGGTSISSDAGTPSDHGGNGSAGDTAAGADGVWSMQGSASGGGGGAGRIRINTMSGSADLSGATLSPSMMAGCFSQGMLAK
jgi:hypothetical protein